jgi:DNA polymerase-3 subunit delta
LSQITKEELRRNLKARDFAPVYFLFGSELYLRDIAAKTISDLALADSQLREFNETEFSLVGGSDQLGTALAAADQLPMMSGRRVIRILDVRITATGAKETVKEDDVPSLERYLTNPSPSTVLILLGDEVDKRKKSAKLLLEKAVAVEFESLDDADAIKWLSSKIRDEGFSADEIALRMLVSYAGHDLRLLNSEASKVMTASLPDKVVTAKLIEDLVSPSRELSNFDLVDFILAGNRSRSLQTVRKILDDGGEPLMIIGLLSSNFQRLMTAKEMIRNNMDKGEIARTLRLPYRKQDEFLAVVRRASYEKLTWMMRRLLETDLAIKTSRGGGGPAGSKMQLEVLVSELVSG